MPIYEYRCEECGTKFEKLVRREDAAPECPSCGQPKVNRELSTFAAHAGGKQQSAPNLPPCAATGRCPTPGACGMN